MLCENLAMDMRERIIALIEADPTLSVRGVSIAAGLGETTLRNFLKGMTRSMTLESIEKIADILGVSSRYIAYGDNEPVTYIWDRIPSARRQQALQVLETFVDESKTA